MKRLIIISLVFPVTLLVFSITFAVMLIGYSKTAGKPKGDILTAATTTAAVAQYDHRLDTYLSALEWCESRGIYSAVNPKDRDGTPSYYSFQFKPETFLSYGAKYGLIPASTTLANVGPLMKDYLLSRSIVRAMTQDSSVDWLQQFPDCVRKYVGFPPKRA